MKLYKKFHQVKTFSYIIDNKIFHILCVSQRLGCFHFSFVCCTLTEVGVIKWKFRISHSLGNKQLQNLKTNLNLIASSSFYRRESFPKFSLDGLSCMNSNLLVCFDNQRLLSSSFSKRSFWMFSILNFWQRRG